MCVCLSAAPALREATGQGSSVNVTAEGCLALGDIEWGCLALWRAGPATLNLLQAQVWEGRRAAVILPLVCQHWLSHGHCPHGDKGLKTRTASDPDVLSLQCPTSISQVLPFSPVSIVLWSRGSQGGAGSAELGTDLPAVAGSAPDFWGRVGWHCGCHCLPAPHSAGRHKQCLCFFTHRGLTRKRRE